MEKSGTCLTCLPVMQTTRYRYFEQAIAIGSVHFCMHRLGTSLVPGLSTIPPLPIFSHYHQSYKADSGGVSEAAPLRSAWYAGSGVGTRP